jgi:hypothetical protein
MAAHKANAVRQRLAMIPGVGPVTALTLAIEIDPLSFESGRHLAAWAGLTPPDHSTGGKGEDRRHFHTGQDSLVAQYATDFFTFSGATIRVSGSDRASGLLYGSLLPSTPASLPARSRRETLVGTATWSSKRARYLGHHPFPVAWLTLTEQPRSWIPRCVFTVQKPAPVRSEGQHNRDKTAHGARKMSDRCVNGYQMLNVFEYRHRIAIGLDPGPKVDERCTAEPGASLACSGTFLQGQQRNPRQLIEVRKICKQCRAVAVVVV